jgi:hypothetical protein
MRRGQLLSVWIFGADAMRGAILLSVDHHDDIAADLLGRYLRWCGIVSGGFVLSERHRHAQYVRGGLLLPGIESGHDDLRDWSLLPHHQHVDLVELPGRLLLRDYGSQHHHWVVL